MSCDVVYGSMRVGTSYDHFLDYVDRLKDGESVSISEWTVPAGLTKDNQSETGSMAAIWVTATEKGTKTITNTMTSSEGRIYKVDLVLTVCE